MASLEIGLFTGLTAIGWQSFVSGMPVIFADSKIQKVCGGILMIEKISRNDMLLALIIRTAFTLDGIRFFTPNDFSQQLGYMKRPAKWRIEPHTHNPVRRSIDYTHEVLFIKSGKVRVDFYADPASYIESRILNPGDVILLAHGGHGFSMLEESEIIEVKQGPYSGDADKTIFAGIGEEKVKIRGLSS
jgi:hypothetical protein